jgi:hypothetical protein
MKRSSATGNKMKKSPVIIYKWKGINCKRIKGNTGKQAPVAKEQASILGKASGISARLRAAFKTILGEPTNREMMYRLNNALQQWLRTGAANNTEPVDSLPSLDGFSFYGKADNRNPLTVITMGRGTDGMAFLQIPAIEDPAIINGSPFYSPLRIEICVACCDLSDIANTVGFETKITITSNEIPVSSQEIGIPLLSGTGRLVVAAVAANRAFAWIAGTLYN